MPRKLEVEIVGDSRKLERAFARSSKSASKFQGTITGLSRGISSTFGTLGVAVGAGAIVAGIKTSIDAASNLNEEITKSQQIFGASADEVEAWSETTTDAFKLSQRESLEAAGNFGAMFRTIGLGTQRTADMSRRLTELGADMASFNNQDPSEMLDRLRSGLAGEAEPLRRFGVLLSEARVVQEAYRSGIARTGDKLTEQQKVQARYNLILQDTKLAQGDAARTGDNWAGVQRELAANFENLAAKLGTVLLPKLTEVVDNFNEWLSDPGNQAQLVNDLTSAIEGLGSAMGVVAEIASTPSRIDEWLKGHHLGALTESGKEIGEHYLEALGLKEGVPDLGPERLPDDRQRQRMQLLEDQRRRNETTQGLITGDARRRRRPGAGGITANERATIRNRIFDARIARQLDRLQDSGLRRQLARLRQIAQEVRARVAITSDAERRLTLEDRLLGILREQRSVQKEIGDQVRAANAALKERADAIKSAVLDRLQRRQADILNRRALEDAQERLRLARRLGGRGGIRAARREVQDVGFDIQRARIEAAPARLTRAGRFSLGNVVTINVHGVTDPETVARKVTEILARRRRRTTTQTRGPAAGTAQGAH